MKKEKLKPKDLLPIAILALITAVTAILLVVMERSIQVDETVLSGTLREKCVALMGEGEYKVILDWTEEGYAVPRPRNVAKMIVNYDNGAVAFQIVVSGYNKDGLNMLIAMNEDGSVKDLVVYINTETPQIGTKVNERDFLDNFVGLNEEVRVVRGNPRNESEVAAITGATRSARAVADAVNIAIDTYDLLFLGGEEF